MMIGVAHVIGMNPILRSRFSGGPGLSCAIAFATAIGNTEASAAVAVVEPTAARNARRPCSPPNTARSTARSAACARSVPVSWLSSFIATPPLFARRTQNGARAPLSVASETSSSRARRYEQGSCRAALRPAHQQRRILDAPAMHEHCSTDEHPSSTACFACITRRAVCEGQTRVLRSFDDERHAAARHHGSRGNALNVRLAVNGTLMRGLALNGNLVAAGATFVRETTTGPSYRLWSIDDR